MERQGWSRREVLKGVGLTAALIGLGGQTFGGEKQAEPVLLGKLSDFPIGSVKTFLEQKVAVVSDEEGLSCISLVCTHARKTIGFDEAKNAFVCKHHGAMFERDGTLLKKPAKSDLTCYALILEGETVFADLQKEVVKGTKLPHPKA